MTLVLERYRVLEPKEHGGRWRVELPHGVQPADEVVIEGICQTFRDGGIGGIGLVHIEGTRVLIRRSEV